MKKLTQLVAAWSLAVVPSNIAGQPAREMYVVNTVDGAEIWVPKSKFDTNAETITYEVKKAGDKYIKKDGTEGVLKADRNEFVGCGKQVVKKLGTAEILDLLQAKGITPTFALS